MAGFYRREPGGHNGLLLWSVRDQLLRPTCAEVIPLRASPVGTRVLRERAARARG